MNEAQNGPDNLEPRKLVSSEVFIKTLAGFVDKNDVHAMVDDQRHMLSRFEKTNEMLLNFNVLSGSRYSASVQEFKKHTQLLVDMKKDLDSIFRRIRNLKQTLSKQYPKAFSACGEVYDVMEMEEEEITISIPVPRSPAAVNIQRQESGESDSIDDKDRTLLAMAQSGDDKQKDKKGKEKSHR